MGEILLPAATMIEHDGPAKAIVEFKDDPGHLWGVTYHANPGRPTLVCIENLGGPR